MQPFPFRAIPALALTLAMGAPALAAPEPAGSLTPQVLAAAGLEAGKNYPGLGSLCNLEQGVRTAGARVRPEARRTLSDSERAERRARAQVAPTQVFDNLYFVGNASVASWVLQTSDGLILIDAMNSNNQAENIIVAGMRKLGLDPDDIRYLVITHAHGDHYGGQEYLVNHFSPRVVMSERDWRELEKPKPEISNPRWGAAPTRDLAVNNGDTLTLGDTTLALYVTPGHTPGTLSLVMPLKDGDTTHYGALWGGTGLNFGPVTQRIRQYSESAARLKAVAAGKGVDVFLSNHPGRDSSLERMQRLAARDTGQPHPFVDPNALGAFDLLRDCSLAQAIRLENKHR